MKVLWISRHELNERNWEILKKAFGDNVEVVQYKDTVTDVNKLKEIIGLERIKEIKVVTERIV